MLTIPTELGHVRTSEGAGSECYQSTDRMSPEDASKERLVQIHYWPWKISERDAFKEKLGMRSQMVIQRGFTSDGYKLTAEIGAWIESVVKEKFLPPGMEWMVVSEDSDLFWMAKKQ